MRVVIKSNWAPYVGTDYCDALGIYDNLEEAQADAIEYAWDQWEGASDDGDDFEDEGPEAIVQEYDPEIHDCLKAGGGSFVEEFERMERSLNG